VFQIVRFNLSESRVDRWESVGLIIIYTPLGSSHRLRDR